MANMIPFRGVKSTRKNRNRKYKPKPWTPICHHTREAYTVYKWYKSFHSFYQKRHKWELIEMALPIYDKDWNVKRYQRMFVELQDLQPYYNKFLENIDFVINVKDI